MIQGRWGNEHGMGAFTLIEILVVSIMMIGLAMALIPRYTGAGMAKDAPPGKAATPIQRAESVECRTNLTQVRQAITMYQNNNERFPGSLQELTTQGVVGSMLACPVGGTGYAYGYDPRTGRAGCRYPGHERY